MFFFSFYNRISPRVYSCTCKMPFPYLCLICCGIWLKKMDPNVHVLMCVTLCPTFSFCTDVLFLNLNLIQTQYIKGFLLTLKYYYSVTLKKRSTVPFAKNNNNWKKKKNPSVETSQSLWLLRVLGSNQTQCVLLIHCNAVVGSRCAPSFNKLGLVWSACGKEQRRGSFWAAVEYPGKGIRLRLWCD